MKWENRDINIVWWEFRKFRKLNHRVTPLRLLKLFFECLLAAPSYTVIEREREREKERQRERQRANISFEITNEKNPLFLSMLLLSKNHNLPDRKVHWETTPDRETTPDTYM